MTMSSSRKAKSFQTVESKWWLWSSRVLTGQIEAWALMGALLGVGGAGGVAVARRRSPGRCVMLVAGIVAVVPAGDVRVEGREHPVRVVPVDPDVPVVVRLEHVGLVDGGPGVVRHGV